MHHPHASFDLLDLKIRVPPHVTSKFSGLSVCSSASDTAVTVTPLEMEPIKNGAAAGGSTLTTFFNVQMGAIVVCLAPLFWVVSFHPGNNSKDQLEQRARQGACFFLLLSPWTHPILASFPGGHQQHIKGHAQWLTLLLRHACLFLGNAAAMLYCAGCPCPWLRMWLLSGAMITAVFQKLLLVPKGNVVLVMISTASAVVVCCLAAVAPLLPNLVMTYRCFQSMAIPMLWLFWQAALGERPKPHT